ncbi:hypothetical protein QJS10_CPA07g00984 [Acorus calamus]|uniref:DUF3511 domain protein n=1 Tax=Acorus calamus TaxID=4465 RepID=A0AAV9EEE8_ACOCL|nr:hypothetical protein QJS10_CPA07g00990 [Acorus calamus]KAK1312256.1 hypothetical protein QJS10_CPA07g00984 [Acorus calamus]
MEDFRSRSCGDGRMEDFYGDRLPPSHSSNFSELRCYSTSYASSQQQQQQQMPRDLKFSSNSKSKKGSSSSKGGWSLSDPELQRKKRVAGYKVYGVEGKMKGSFRKSFRWLKDRYSQVVYGRW